MGSYSNFALSILIGSRDEANNGKVVTSSAPHHVESPQDGSKIINVHPLIQKNGLEISAPDCISHSQQPHKQRTSLNYASLNLQIPKS